ncbi:MAG: hypothetical protein WA958_12525 [Tunicatimonas sp.]
MMLITHGFSSLSGALVRTLNQHNFNYLVVTDHDADWKPSADWRIQEFLPPTPLPNWFTRNAQELEFAFCLDASSEADDAYFRTLWQQCIAYQVPLIFRTDERRSAWVTQQEATPFFWAGLRVPHPAGPTDQDVAQAAYFLVHHRQQSGIYAPTDDRIYGLTKSFGR